MSRSAQKPKRRRVVFYYDDPHAHEVILLGDFNQWDLTKHRMQKDEHGQWKKIAVLLPGRYEYRFKVDGKWRDDPTNEHCCRNCFGSLNNVLVVKE